MKTVIQFKINKIGIINEISKSKIMKVNATIKNLDSTTKRASWKGMNPHSYTECSAWFFVNLAELNITIT